MFDKRLFRLYYDTTGYLVQIATLGPGSIVKPVKLKKHFVVAYTFVEKAAIK